MILYPNKGRLITEQKSAKLLFFYNKNNDSKEKFFKNKMGINLNKIKVIHKKLTAFLWYD